MFYDLYFPGKPNPDPNHPDYVPSVFQKILTPRTLQKGNKKIERFNSAKRRKLFQSPPPNENVPLQEQAPNVVECLASDETEGPEFTAVRLQDHESWKEAGFRRCIEQTEREQFQTEMDNLRAERDALASQLEAMEQCKFGWQIVENNDEKCKFYTGISWTVFMQTFTFLHQFLPFANPGTLSLKDQFFITLVKLRQNPNSDYLADQVCLPRSTVLDIFWKWVKLIDSKLSFVIQWPDRETIFRTIPPAFKAKFPRLTNIIDCFEIFIENPTNLKARAQCYSNYKKHTTVKFLIACNPLGAVIFLSRAWGGRVSDIEITRQSGYISRKYHFPGDQILADRGFTLQEDLATECSAELILPAFTKGRKQLPAQEVETARNISSVRILIERVIGLMKNRFAILQGTLPIRFIQSAKSESNAEELASIDICVRSCAILTNLGDGIV